MPRRPYVPPKLSAGVVVLRPFGATDRVLLLRIFRYWDFPKGGVEPGETPLHAACREVQEEAGLTGLDFRWGQGFIETAPYSRPRKVARYYLAVSRAGAVTMGVNPELGRPEHEEARWFDWDEARPVLVPRLQTVLDWARARASGGAPRAA